jgi:hypothetical protein
VQRQKIISSLNEQTESMAEAKGTAVSSYMEFIKRLEEGRVLGGQK